jgi:K+-transporting ATPase KdpF subunit
MVGMDYAIGLMASIATLAYLVVAMLRPENF